jgi:hypothetical protein
MDDPPIGESIFEFELDVLDSAQTGNVLLTLTTTPLANGSVIVTSQATGRIQKIKIAEGDMLTSPAEIIHDLHVAAYQLSAFVGRGEPSSRPQTSLSLKRRTPTVVTRRVIAQHISRAMKVTTAWTTPHTARAPLTSPRMPTARLPLLRCAATSSLK